MASAFGAIGADPSIGYCACLRRELSGEPDVVNLHLRFDEGRVGRATRVAFSPTLPPEARKQHRPPGGENAPNAFSPPQRKTLLRSENHADVCGPRWPPAGRPRVAAPGPSITPRAHGNHRAAAGKWSPFAPPPWSPFTPPLTSIKGGSVDNNPSKMEPPTAIFTLFVVTHCVMADSHSESAGAQSF